MKSSMIEYMKEVKTLVAKDARIRLLRTRRAVHEHRNLPSRQTPISLVNAWSCRCPGLGSLSRLSLIKTRLGIWRQRRSKRNSKILIYVNCFTKQWREGHLHNLWSKVTSANVWDIMTSISYSYGHISQTLTTCPTWSWQPSFFRCGNLHSGG
jgi:hypothetical protein